MPTVNWNIGTRAVIRTSLGGNRKRKLDDVRAKSPTETVDDAMGKSDRIEEVVENLVKSPKTKSPTSHGSHVKEDRSKLPSHGSPQARIASPTTSPTDSDSEEGEVSESEEDGEVLINVQSEAEDYQPGSGEVSESGEGSEHSASMSGSEEDISRAMEAEINEQEDAEDEKDAIMDISNSNGQSRRYSQLKPSMAASPADPTTMMTVTPVASSCTLAELNADDLELQLRYFYPTNTPEEVNPSDLARCLTCKASTHLSSSCPNLTCSHCISTGGKHFADSCPQTTRCQKCHERGHKHTSCPYKLARIVDREVTCDMCHLIGHFEQDCELRWRTSGRPWEMDFSSLRIRLSCYECGLLGHLGNDCPRRAPRKVLGSSSWTTKGIFRGVAGSHQVKSLRPRVQEAGGAGMAIKGMAKRTEAMGSQDFITIDDSDEDELGQGSNVGRNGAECFIRPQIHQNTGPKGGIKIAGMAENQNGGRRNGKLGALSGRGGATGVDLRGRSNYQRDRQQPDDFQRRSRSPPYGRGGTATSSTRGSGQSYRPLPSSAKKAWVKGRN
ncbi:hypothetical protein MMC25_001306 [Agyrium rufum]|nr:hypothetical protein [Agyrium rufum]